MNHIYIIYTHIHTNSINYENEQINIQLCTYILTMNLNENEKKIEGRQKKNEIFRTNIIESDKTMAETR